MKGGGEDTEGVLLIFPLAKYTFPFESVFLTTRESDEVEKNGDSGVLISFQCCRVSFTGK